MARTSHGILAIWREGEVHDDSIFPRHKQEALRLAGEVGIRAAARAAFDAREFGPPEWHHPQDAYLDHSVAAWKLGELSAQFSGLWSLVYRGAAMGEVCSLRVALQEAYTTEIVPAARGLADIQEPGAEGLREFHLSRALGQLFVPNIGVDDIPPALFEQLIGDTVTPSYDNAQIAA